MNRDIKCRSSISLPAIQNYWYRYCNKNDNDIMVCNDTRIMVNNSCNKNEPRLFKSLGTFFIPYITLLLLATH